MFFFDAHCDILSAIEKPEELFSNAHHWDARRALKNGPFIQVFTSFAGSKFRDNPKAHMEAQLQKALMAEKAYPERLKLLRSASDLEEFTTRHKLENRQTDSRDSRVYGFLEAEGAEILGGSLSELDRLYGLGLRILTLVWNFDNEVCDSVAGQNRHHGLSPFGKQVLEKAQKLGILIDVSHGSDKTLEDVLELTQKPITASHSNARALCAHRRNLTDSQIKAIARMGGVIGINFYPSFLRNSGNAQFMDIIEHIDYMAALVGTSSIGFGSDFDGFDDLPEGMKGVEDLSRIIEVLLKLNYSEEAVKAIAGGNFSRLMGLILQT